MLKVVVMLMLCLLEVAVAVEMDIKDRVVDVMQEVAAALVE